MFQFSSLHCDILMVFVAPGGGHFLVSFPISSLHYDIRAYSLWPRVVAALGYSSCLFMLHYLGCSLWPQGLIFPFSSRYIITCSLFVFGAPILHHIQLLVWSCVSHGPWQFLAVIIFLSHSLFEIM